MGIFSPLLRSSLNTSLLTFLDLTPVTPVRIVFSVHFIVSPSTVVFVENRRTGSSIFFRALTEDPCTPRGRIGSILKAYVDCHRLLQRCLLSGFSGRAN